MLRLEFCADLTRVDPRQWNALVGDGSPFLEWEWLASLEEAGCVSPRTGWLPQHLLLRDGTSLVAACPLYVKGHSDGEFVFDHAWAKAAHYAGLQYYPKLLAAVPFTPVTGARFLTRQGVDRQAVLRTLGLALRDACRTIGFSSVHVNFCLPDEVAALADAGFIRRTGIQFHWRRAPTWRSFEDFLAALRSKRRNEIRRERRAVAAQGIKIEARAGSALPDDVFGALFRLYKSTIDKFLWGRQYLNEPFFDLLRRRWRKRLVVLLARRGSELIAGAICIRKGGTLYGRYWGCFEEVRHLHFVVCYYAAIDYCLRAGIVRFEPGAGGEHKHLRGFDATPTESMHFVADAALARAVEQHLIAERDAVEQERAWFDEHSALKAGTIAPFVPASERTRRP